MPQTQKKQKQKQLSKNLFYSSSLCFVSPSISHFNQAPSVSLSFFCLFPATFFFSQRKGLIAPEKEKGEQKEDILNSKSLWDWILNFLSFFITFSFKFQGRSDGVSICQATRLLFLSLSTSPDGLPQPRYASPDLYVKFIVSPVTSATPGQLK